MSREEVGRDPGVKQEVKREAREAARVVDSKGLASSASRLGIARWIATFARRARWKRLKTKMGKKHPLEEYGW